MKIFRIGELEYEFKEYEGENVIGIHVPSDSNLSKEAVDNSLKQANIFFTLTMAVIHIKIYLQFMVIIPGIRTAVVGTIKYTIFSETF